MATAEKEDTLERLAKEFTAMRVVILGAIALVAFGVTLSSVWSLPRRVEAVEKRTTNLEHDHAADHAEVQGIKRSVEWQQDTMWKLTEQLRVPDVKPTPTPAAPTPTSTPTP